MSATGQPPARLSRRSASSSTGPTHLRVLLSHSGRVVTKARLLQEVWGVAYAGESQYLHVYVNRLRRKLALATPSAHAEEIIRTEPGVGYRIAPQPD